MNPARSKTEHQSVLTLPFHVDFVAAQIFEDSFLLAFYPDNVKTKMLGVAVETLGHCFDNPMAA